VSYWTLGSAVPLRARMAVSAIGLPLLDMGIQDGLRSRIAERSKTVSSEDHRSRITLSGAHSRRSALHAGGALLAGVGALAVPLRVQRSAATQATPTTEGREGGPLLVQSFSHGSLFPTQGDADSAPYTAILWDAADRGFFFADCTGGVAGVVPSERVLANIGTETPVQAVLVSPSTEANDSDTSPLGVWAMSLVYGDLGSDPGAVTYQGEPLAGEYAASWLGTAPAAMPEGPQDFGQGFLIVTGLSGFEDSGGVRLNLA
jgi:hypothetical protein